MGSKPGLGVGGVESNSVPIPLSDLRSQLPDVKKVTISAPGVLLEEWEPEKLEKGATIKPDAAEIIKELASSMHVYILAHVSGRTRFVRDWGDLGGKRSGRDGRSCRFGSWEDFGTRNSAVAFPPIGFL